MLAAFRKWLDDIAPKLLPKGKLGKAISYTRNQWDHLIRYAENGQAPIDNNLLERDIRPFCTGRNSWLFSDTPAGAKAQRRRLQPRADLPCLRYRSLRLAALHSDRTTAAS